MPVCFWDLAAWDLGFPRDARTHAESEHLSAKAHAPGAIARAGSVLFIAKMKRESSHFSRRGTVLLLP
jgi:hypothetical protein